MSVSAGTRLGPYEITGKLGAGGMGEVYRATDTKLKREVAIKVLPPAFTADRERLARFEREAQLLAQLHHPNIASIFGIEDAEGVRALVMELVEGPTLGDRLANGALAVEECLGIAKQVADALEAAHEKGIVHRDLKPQNIKASVDGKVKVLDFGLAKTMDPAGSGARASSGSQLAQSPTMTLGATEFGVILGTAAYMAPEQAKGLAVDKRADIWAFGVVLYEMLAGRSLFAGDTVTDTLAAVLRAEVDLAALPPGTAPALVTLVRRCLERNPKSRLHDIADARIVLEDLIAGRGDGGAALVAALPAASNRPAWRLAVVGAVAGLAIGAAIAWTLARFGAAPSLPPRAARFALLPPEGTSFQRGLALSPDGQHIAFSTLAAADGRVSLWVRSLDSLEARELPDTDGARLPFWAPDSRRIGFFSGRSLKWTDAKGGSPIEVLSTSSVQDVRGAAWGADDMIVFAPSYTGPLYAVSALGGEPVPATRVTDDGAIGTTRFPCFLPDGRRFVYYAAPGTGTEPGDLWLGRLGSLDAKRLGPAHSMAVHAEPGYLLYARTESLVAHRFDDEREELIGAPDALGLPMGGSLAVSGLRSIAVGGGTLLHRNDRRSATQLLLVDRAGRVLEALSDPTSTWNYAPRISPDGRHLLLARYLLASGGLGQIWSYDLERRLATRQSFDDGDDFVATWIGPGSREYLANSLRAGPNRQGTIIRGSIDRPGEESIWIEGDRMQWPMLVTPDGRRVIYQRDEGLGKLQLWIRDLEGSGEGTRLTAAAASEAAPDISHDGHWLAYASNATRDWEVYVRRVDGTGGVVRISNSGGTAPRFRSDGRELFYVDAVGRLVAVPLAPAAPGDRAIRPGAPQILFPAILEEANDRQYDVSADGQRFVLNRSVANEHVPIVVVQGWTALLDPDRETREE